MNTSKLQIKPVNQSTNGCGRVRVVTGVIRLRKGLAELVNVRGENQIPQFALLYPCGRHLSKGTLFKFANRKLNDSRINRVGAHLDSCEVCRRELGRVMAIKLGAKA